MIYSLSGKIIKKTLNAVVVSCGGVGYYVQCPTSVAGALPGVGREATLYTVMSVTENDISLYGFATEEQQSCFAAGLPSDFVVCAWLCLPSVWPILSQQRSNAQVFCVLPHQMLPNQLTLPVGFWYNAFRRFC